MIRLALVLLVTALTAPAVRADDGNTFNFYWDRYAVRMSTQTAPYDSATSPAYRSQFAKLSDAADEALAAGQPRNGSTGGVAATKEPGASPCDCECAHKS